MVFGEVRLHGVVGPGSAEAYRQELWHISDPSHGPGAQCVGEVGGKVGRQKGQIIKDLENHVFRLG